jgi:citrate lyase gamma subunit
MRSIHPLFRTESPVVIQLSSSVERIFFHELRKVVKVESD